MEFITPPQLSARPNEALASYRSENPAELFNSFENERKLLVEETENARPVVRNLEGEAVYGPPTLAESAEHLQAKNNLLAFDLRRDTLTGALNREGFIQTLSSRLGQISRNNADNSQVDLLLFMDTDRFKAVNDTHGHGAGDFVLKALASTLALEKTLRVKPQDDRITDPVARLGGDEFAALIQGVPTDEFETVLARIRETLHSVEIPYRSQGKELLLEVGMSIGAFVIKHGAEVDASDALSKADEAMYHEKQKRHPHSKNMIEKLFNRYGWERKRGR